MHNARIRFVICRGILDLPPKLHKASLGGNDKAHFSLSLRQEGTDKTGAYCVIVHKSAVHQGLFKDSAMLRLSTMVLRFMHLCNDERYR